MAISKLHKYVSSLHLNIEHRNGMSSLVGLPYTKYTFAQSAICVGALRSQLLKELYGYN